MGAGCSHGFDAINCGQNRFLGVANQNPIVITPRTLAEQRTKKVGGDLDLNFDKGFEVGISGILLFCLFQWREVGMEVERFENGGK